MSAFGTLVDINGKALASDDQKYSGKLTAGDNAWPLNY